MGFKKAPKEPKAKDSLSIVPENQHPKLKEALARLNNEPNRAGNGPDDARYKAIHRSDPNTDKQPDTTKRFAVPVVEHKDKPAKTWN